MNNSNIITHSYNGIAIEQRVTDEYVNLTQMAKAGGKQVGHYLDLKSTDEYLEALSSDTEIPISDLVIVVKGGDLSVVQQGTWAHKLVAVDFAQWCNVKFRIWANKTILNAISEKAHPETKQMSQLELLQVIINQAVENERRQLQQERELQTLKSSVEEQNKVVNAELDRIENCHGRYFTIMGYASYHKFTIGLPEAKLKGKAATKLCKENDLPVNICKDPRFGKVNSYPESVLDKIFDLL
jgi:hypothetical protein